MSRSKSSTSKKSSSQKNKGFVFVLEVVIALVLFLGVLQIAALETSPQENFLTAKEQKQSLHDAVLSLDQSGFFLEAVDKSGLDSAEKMELIYDKLHSMLPANSGLRIDLNVFQADSASCKVTKDFSNCFDELSLFFPAGEEIPSDKALSHERLYVLKKEPPQQCTDLTRLDLQAKKENLQKLFFSSPTKPKLFFAGLDANKPFDINVTLRPPGQTSFNCDENIWVDLNIKVRDANLAARNYVDMELVFNDSNNMKGLTTFAKDFSPSSASGGTGSCANPSGGWVSLPSITFSKNYDKKSYKTMFVTLAYSGSGGACNPKLRVLKSPNTYTPSQDGNTSISPINATINDFDQSSTYTVQIWSDHVINYDINVYLRKAYTTKAVLVDFLQYSHWQKSGNNGDYIGVVSYNGGVEQNLQVAQANADVSRIQNLSFELTTAPIGNGMHVATTELIANNVQRPKVKDYMIVISDGSSTAGAYTALNEAYRARDSNVTIYAVGVGLDVNDVELKQIVQITGGKYYSISDFDALTALINQLAQEITNNAIGSGNQVLVDSNLVIPALNCSYYVDLGGGTCVNGDRNYLAYRIGDLNYGNTWLGHYVLNIPCNSRDACGISTLKILPLDTNLNWRDVNLLPHITDINIHFDVNFKYRDLMLTITKYIMPNPSEIYLDVNLANVGLLALPANPVVEFFWETIGGYLFAPVETITTLGAPGSYHLIFDKAIDREGKIIAIINRDYPIRECPGNNAQSVTCLNAPQPKYYVLDVWSWKK